MRGVRVPLGLIVEVTGDETRVLFGSSDMGKVIEQLTMRLVENPKLPLFFDIYDPRPDPVKAKPAKKRARARKR